MENVWLVIISEKKEEIINWIELNWIEQLSIFNINDKWCDEAEQMMNPFLSLFGQFPYCKMLSRTSCHVCVSVMTVIWSSSSRFFSTVNEQSSSYLYSWGENEIKKWNFTFSPFNFIRFDSILCECWVRLWKCQMS